LAQARKVLITGGAGFVGSHTADALLERGHTVRIYDNLSPQVHANGPPQYLPQGAEFIGADIRDVDKLRAAVRDIEVIFHFAAAVGVGQSMYRISEYTAVNNLGTANLLQAILDSRSQPEKIIIASSMSIYGEGKSLCQDCGEVAPPLRSVQQLRHKQWEVRCPQCGETVLAVLTPESKPLECGSVYALSKKNEEEMALLFGRTYGIAVVALRFFNIYGPRQSLSNPYTGVAAIFASRLLNDKPPVIFEDGLQMRDFVSVHDITRANLLAMENRAVDGMALNIGSGQPVTMRQVASELAAALDLSIPSVVSGQYRSGDIRHCFADISKARNLLGYRPRVTLQQGLGHLACWLRSQAADDRVERAIEDLSFHGLVA
jgi:dTDP-L-rhamnose 4-epimerase